MSTFYAQAALEKKLATLDNFPTAYENMPFNGGTAAYQQISFLPNTPIDHAVTLDVTEWRGIFQVSLCYQLGVGRGEAGARAQLIAAHFAPPQNLIEGDITVELLRTAHIAQGIKDDTRWVVPVSITWRAFKT